MSRRTLELAAARRQQREEEADARKARGRLTRLAPGEQLETRYVLGGAYRGSDINERSFLTHAVLVDSSGRDVRTLCSQPVDHMADSLSRSPAELRDPPTCKSCLSRWEKLGGGAMRPNARKDPFLKRMENAASWLPSSAWYGRKVFLAPLAHEMNIPMAEFERTVIRLHQAGIIELSRADMVQAMDPRLVRQSEVHPPGMPDVTYHFWNATAVAKPMRSNHSAVYYVWLIDYRGVPLDSEGPYGPMSLDRASAFARIGAQNGDHDRAVSEGLNPEAESFEIVRRYRRGTGERIL